MTPHDEEHEGLFPFVSFPLLKAHLFFLLFLSRDSMGREEGLEEDVLSVLVVKRM